MPAHPKRETESSPVPWEIIGTSGTAIWSGSCIVTGRAGPRVNQKLARANAALIVRAVNSFDELVGMLKAATHALRSYQFGNGAPDLAESTADACEKLIAKAKG